MKLYCLVYIPSAAKQRDYNNTWQHDVKKLNCDQKIKNSDFKRKRNWTTLARKTHEALLFNIIYHQQPSREI